MGLPNDSDNFDVGIGLGSSTGPAGCFPASEANLGSAQKQLCILASHLHTIFGRSSIAKSSMLTRLRLRFRSIVRDQIWRKAER